MVESGIKLVLLWVVAYPVVGALAALVFAGPVAAAEDTANFGDAYLFLLMLMTLTDIPLTAWAPIGTTGIDYRHYPADVDHSDPHFVCVFVGVSAGPLLDPFLDALGLVPRAAGPAVRKHFLVYVLGYPVVCLLFGLVFGGILAASESWPFEDGFVMALGEVTNTKVTLLVGRHAGPEDFRRQVRGPPARRPLRSHSWHFHRSRLPYVLRLFRIFIEK